MEEDCADARRGPLGGQPPRSVSARNVCGVTPAPAVRRSAASCPSSLDLWLRCPQQFPLITCESYVTMAADISRSVSTIHFRLLKRLSRSEITGRLLES